MASYMMERPFPYNAAKFRFAFRLHLGAIIGLALVALLILQFSPRLLIVAYLLIIAMVTVIALTLLSAMWPVRTTHTVDGESVVLRQGLNFKLSIPLSKISKARRTEVGTGRTGINLDRANGVLEVIAAGPEAVRLRLNEPVVHKGMLVREVLVDVLEPKEFIECIRERKKGAVLIERLDGGRTAKPAEEEAPEPEEEAPEGPAPEEPQGPAAEKEEKPPKADDEDEIELVPALPSKDGAPARVVRIPKRKP